MQERVEHFIFVYFLKRFGGSNVESGSAAEVVNAEFEVPQAQR
jgi:hypothetical protein